MFSNQYGNETSEFLSTPSARRATTWDEGTGEVLVISIHALREEGDIQVAIAFLDFFDFYPRPPRGGRQCRILSLAYLGRFLSTPSARRATFFQDSLFAQICISIHALREEGDSKNRDKISIFL